MDFVVFVTVAIFTVVLALKNRDVSDDGSKVVDVVEDVKRKAILNESYYNDEQAFCEIVKALGFNNVGGKL